MTTAIDVEIRPFTVESPSAELTDLRRRVTATRWPSKELVDDRSQGVQLATAKALATYWVSGYDWRKAEAKLNALPQFKTLIDGIDIHFIHVKSRHENALPLIMTHGWPGSVVELLEAIGPLTDPTAHGGSADDAFHLVLPSVPGYGFSGEPAELGWWAGRVAQAWPELMRRLGYSRYVAQGGDVGAAVTDAMGRLAPEGLLGIHTNLFVPALGGVMPSDTDEERRRRADRRVPGDRLRLLPRTGHAAADDWLRPAGFARGPRGVDARPRHRRLLQDRRRLRRREAVGQPHPGPHPRQHHAVLADGHRRLGRPLVLGERGGHGEGGGPGAAADEAPLCLHDVPRRDLEDAAQLGREGLPQHSSTSTRSTGAATSPLGRSRSCSPPSCGTRSGRCERRASFPRRMRPIPRGGPHLRRRFSAPPPSLLHNSVRT